MRYWLRFVVALAAVVAAALVFGSLIAGLPVVFVAGVSASAYGLLVAANILPPGRPPGPRRMEDDDLVPFDYRATLPYPAPPFPRMPTSAAALPNDETGPYGYDPLDEAYAYYASEREGEGQHRAATPILFAGLGVLALGALSIGAVVAQASRGGGAPDARPSATPALALVASAVPSTSTPTSTPTATPTRAAPSPTPGRRIVVPTPPPTATPTATETPEPQPTATPPADTPTVPRRRATEPPPTAEPTQPTQPPKRTATPQPTPSGVPTTPRAFATPVPSIPPARGNADGQGPSASPPARR